ncbi:hypothetical protein [Streptomyces sp. NPDC002403]
MPEVLASEVRDPVVEYEAKESPTAIFPHDADKLRRLRALPHRWVGAGA